MKILALTAQNIKPLVAVYIKPDGKVIQITGRNGSGKTTCLDAIWWALGGTKHIQSSPIRKGANEALIVLDIGAEKVEFRVTRRFHKREDASFTSQVTIESADGRSLAQPQTILNTFLGALTYNPLQFAAMKPEEQFETLRGLVSGVDFEAIEQLNRGDYEHRTIANRRSGELRAQANAIELVTKVPSARVDVTALAAEMAEAADTNTKLAEYRASRQRAAQNIAERQRTIEDREQRLEAARREIAALEAATEEDRRILKTEKEALESAPPIADPVDVSSIRGQIEAADRVNRAFDDAQNKQRLDAQAADLEAEAEGYTDAIKKRTAEAKAAIAAANLPIDGISFGNREVLLNGFPFSQASGAEKLRTSIAVGMALNPKLRVMLIDEASALDEDSMRLVAEMAETKDHQVWMTRVDPVGTSAVVIEDGHAHLLAEAAE